MANRYSFQLHGPVSSTSFGARLGSLGPMLYNALQAGMQTRQDMLDLSDREQLRPNELAAKRAQYNQSRNAGNLGATVDDMQLDWLLGNRGDIVGGPGTDPQVYSNADMYINNQLNLPSLDDSGDTGLHMTPEREPYGSFYR